MSILRQLLSQWFSPQRLLNWAFRLWPNREFLVFRGQRFTRRAVLTQVKALAAGLSALGVTQGDRVAVLLPACPEAVYAQFLPRHLGSIHMPLNPLLGEQELREILRHSQARVILAAQDWYGLQQAALLARLKPDLPDLQQIVVVATEPGDPPALPQVDGILSYADLLSGGKAYPKVKVKPNDVVLLAYTSGTTGQPKGVVHTVARIWGLGMNQIGPALTQHSLRCLLLPYPPYHYAGMFGLTAALMAGGKVLLMDRFDPDQMLSLIEREKVTQIGGSVTIYRLLLAAAKNRSCDLSSVRRLTFSSEKLPLDLARSLYELFHCKLDNFYGTTEAHLIAWTSITGGWQAAADTVGKPLPGTEVRVVDDARRPLPEGVVGEFAVRTSQMMLGYYRDPQGTAEVLDSQGWFYTGDAGYIDPNGCLCITGRIKDVINRGGEKVYPEEVESFLETHPDVQRAAVIGVRNALAGEDIVAFIVPRLGAVMDLKEILRFCRGKIAPYKIPSDIRLIAQLPTTPTGKVQKYKLRENFSLPSNRTENQEASFA